MIRILLSAALFAAALCSHASVNLTGRITDTKIVQTSLRGSQLRLHLLSEFSKWKGTRYRWGGNSRGGIDCSAFARKVLAKTLRKKLPRTTSELSHTGFYVSRKKLRSGDLVFFMTKPDVRHVGVSVGHHQFIHASGSRGVTLSKLTNNYWKQRYLTARRVIGQAES
ncbi:NlpC/P60 family protein [Dryocola sp. BD586]|uniref:NlpC/P60 family protein n=1 Tax=Dryocola sp. BD586 TaxID=3133271 RepID=UPI003F503DBF